MTEHAPTGPLRRLVIQAVGAGCRDSYEFAEWLVHEVQHFGDPEQFDDPSDLESAWIQAEEWWVSVTGSPHRVRITDEKARSVGG